MSDDKPRLNSLLLAASEIESADERVAFLAKACGDDHDLRQQVERLLQSDEQAVSFTGQPPVELDATVVPDSSADKRAASLQAGLTAAFSEDQSFVIGSASHSVLKSLSQTVNVPHVMLRDADDGDPITKPSSPEIPQSDSDGRYRLAGEIARGGMGAILKGRDTDLGRDLAIKVLLDSHKDRPEVIQRFIEEAQIGGQLQHPGIAPVYELGQFSDKRPFFAMKLVKGETMSKLLADREDSASDRGKLLGIFEHVCQTMAYAHSRGVIHRDLKPANIMVGAFGEVQVMDWGLAKVLSDGGVADEKKAHDKQQYQSNIQTLRSGLGSDVPDAVDSVGSQTQMGSVMGTLAYMPPEQALGEIDSLDERADVFGLGAILCKILTGQPPYVGVDGTSIYRLASRGKLDDAFARLEACGADIDLIGLTKHCLKLEPNERPRDASEVAGRVTGYLESVETKLRETEQQRAVATARAEEERKRRRVQLALVASVLMMLALGGAGWMYLEKRSADQQRELAARKQEEQNDAEATRLVEGLLQADTLQVKTIIGNLADYRKYAKDDLSKALAESPDDSNAKLHTALAMLSEDESVLPFLKQRLLTVTPIQFGTVSDLLAEHKSNLVADYWQIVDDSSKTPVARFQAACALASYDAENEHWQDAKFVEFVSGHLVDVLPSELLPWRNALRPVKAHLTAPLATIYRDSNKDVQVRGFATDTLADYFSDDADGLFDLLADANEKQFGTMFGKLVTHRERAVELGNAEVARTPAEDANEAAKESLAIRQANAAVMLLRANAAGQVWPRLKHSSDPRVRSKIIHWLSPRGGNAATIISRYKQESDITIKRALLLCLGEFKLSDAEKQPLIETLLTVYRNDPDAGLHAAAEWLLMQWQQGDKIAAVDKVLQQEEEQLAANNDTQRQWYINGQGQTFVIVDADEFQMGSPDWEQGSVPSEQLHRQKIDRRFAISTKEVTKGQWREFYASVKINVWAVDQEQLKPYIRTDDSPMVALTWYEVTHYCNWLSEQEQIPEEQWCYEKNEENEYGPGMKAKDKFWELSGYRLPTEAEWEFACRAGASTSRYYGVTETLLPNYAWYQVNGDDHTWPVASLKPNDLGLFDMQGNAFEWVYDVFTDYVSGSTDADADMPTTTAVSDSTRRVLRGGSFLNLLSGVRAAQRSTSLPSSRYNTNGFRPSKTYH